MGNSKINVIVVDDHAGVRAGITRLLESAEDILVIGEGSNGADAVRLAESQDLDVMLLDVELPVLRGDEVVRQIQAGRSTVKVLAVSSYNDQQFVQGMLENGASGYITKDEAPNLLVEAIRSVYHGDEPWVSPRAAKSINQPLGEEPTLTQREFEILYQLLQDKPANEISYVLGMEEEQVGKYLRLIMIKLGVDSLSSLKRVAQEMFSSDD